MGSGVTVRLLHLLPRRTDETSNIAHKESDGRKTRNFFSASRSGISLARIRINKG